MNTTPSQNDPLSIEPIPTDIPATETPSPTGSTPGPAWGTPVDQGPTTAVNGWPSGSGSEPGPTHPGYGPSGDAGYGSAGAMAPPPRPTPAAGLFDAVRRLGVVRPDRGRMAAGVAAGLANRWGVSPVAVRVAFVVVSLFFGAGLFLYGLLWMFLPHPDGRIHAQEVLRGTLTAGFFGALVALLAGAPFDGVADNGPGWLPVLVVGGLIALLVHRHRSPAGRR